MTSCVVAQLDVFEGNFTSPIQAERAERALDNGLASLGHRSSQHANEIFIVEFSVVVTLESFKQNVQLFGVDGHGLLLEPVVGILSSHESFGLFVHAVECAGQAANAV